MAGTLRRAGFHVIVWNRDSGRCQAVARTSGAEVADSAKGAAGATDIAITSLADDAAVRAVYADALEGFHDGQVVLEMSTIAPETVRAVEPSVRARGARLLDAPVSGSVPVVERGELLIMAGGEADALDRARPVLEAMSSKIIHAGELDGATISSRSTRPSTAQRGALGGVVLAERAGVARRPPTRSFASGAAAAPYVLTTGAAFERPVKTRRVPADWSARTRRLIPRARPAWGPRCRRRRRNRDVVRSRPRDGWPITTQRGGRVLRDSSGPPTRRDTGRDDPGSPMDEQRDRGASRRQHSTSEGG